LSQEFVINGKANKLPILHYNINIYLTSLDRLFDYDTIQSMLLYRVLSV